MKVKSLTVDDQYILASKHPNLEAASGAPSKLKAYDITAKQLPYVLKGSDGEFTKTFFSKFMYNTDSS